MEVKKQWPRQMNEDYHEVSEEDCGHSNCENCDSQNCIDRLILEKNYPTDGDGDWQFVEEIEFNEEE